MPYLPNGTYAESIEEYLRRLEIENASMRQELQDLHLELVHLSLERNRSQRIASECEKEL